MTSLYFKNKETGKRYKVISLDKTRGVVILQGEHAQFEEPYSKERFQEMGYVLEKEDDDAEQ
jgi:ABC-type transporter MlaC component